VNPEKLPPPPAANLPASLRARVLTDAPRLARKLPKPLALGAVLAIGAGWVAFMAYHAGRRDNWSALPLSASWAVLAELALAAALSTVVALARGSLMLGPSARRILWSLSVPVVAAALVALFVPNTTPTPSGALLRYALACDAGAMIVGIPVLAVLVYGQRGRILASPGLVGAVAGVAAATWGHVVLHWGCPWTDLGHVLLGHIAPSIPLAIGGAVFARWLNRARALRG
jgi:hypothetical protein